MLWRAQPARLPYLAIHVLSPICPGHLILNFDYERAALVLISVLPKVHYPRGLAPQLRLVLRISLTSAVHSRHSQGHSLTARPVAPLKAILLAIRRIELQLTLYRLVKCEVLSASPTVLAVGSDFTL